jgi:hypothetical protein
LRYHRKYNVYKPQIYIQHRFFYVPFPFSRTRPLPFSFGFPGHLCFACLTQVSVSSSLRSALFTHLTALLGHTDTHCMLSIKRMISEKYKMKKITTIIHLISPHDEQQYIMSKTSPLTSTLTFLNGCEFQRHSFDTLSTLFRHSFDTLSTLFRQFIVLHF